MLRHRMHFIVILLMGLVFAFVKCTEGNQLSGDVRGNEYAGSKACIACHKEIATTYSHNFHQQTAAPASNTALKKLLLPDSPFYFQDGSCVQVEAGKDSFYQSLFADGKKTMSYSFDIAFGSGEKAQTFASWQGGKLLQLPLTYITDSATWLNSPGFPISHARFNRVIGSRCFTCHTSYIGTEMVQSGPVTVEEKLNQNAILYGIDCERCHGPAAAHVQYQKEHQQTKEGRFITRISSLTRQQQLDACAICHAGSDLTPQRSLFSFRPGDTLAHFYYPEFEASQKEPDVHGKQMQLLAASACFQKSNLTCTTCHNAHAASPQNVTVFISKCMNCHQASEHASNMLVAQQKGSVTGNCITCHMPLQSSTAISFNTLQKNSAYLLRTHRIAVYPQ